MLFRSLMALARTFSAVLRTGESGHLSLPILEEKLSVVDHRGLRQQWLVIMVLEVDFCS